jgi:uncharacterized protein YraI
MEQIRCWATASMSAQEFIGMQLLKVAELNTRARVLSPTNVRSGPQNPESCSRILCPLNWH